jgi:hypothetical protein
MKTFTLFALSAAVSGVLGSATDAAAYFRRLPQAACDVTVNLTATQPGVWVCGFVEDEDFSKKDVRQINWNVQCGEAESMFARTYLVDDFDASVFWGPQVNVACDKNQSPVMRVPVPAEWARVEYSGHFANTRVRFRSDETVFAGIYLSE